MEDGCRYDALESLASGRATAAAFQALQAAGRPFLLTEALGPDFAAWWCREVLRRLGPETLIFLEGNGSTGARKALQNRFSAFAEEVGRLSDRSHFAYAQSELLAEKAPDLVASLWKNVPAAVPVGDRNLFALWPRGISPADAVLTLGGGGARTQLVREGLAAAQAHLCLRGHLRFKLLPDDPEKLGPLCPMGEPFGISDEEGRPVFDVSLNLCSDLDLFATEMAGQTPLSHLDSFGPDLERWPDAELLPRALEVLLKPGEMLLVPGGWWLQAYFDEESWLVSASYLDEPGLDRVLPGVMEYCGVDPCSIFALDSMPPPQRVNAVLAAALGTRGHGEGRRVLDRLRQMDKQKDAELAKSQSQSTAEQKAGHMCAVCGRRATTVCSRCKNFWLCGMECQRKSWPEHRQVCVRVRQ